MCFFFFKQNTAYEIKYGLVGSEMCIRDREEGLGGVARGGPDGHRDGDPEQHRDDARPHTRTRNLGHERKRRCHQIELLLDAERPAVSYTHLTLPTIHPV